MGTCTSYGMIVFYRRPMILESDFYNVRYDNFLGGIEKYFGKGICVSWRGTRKLQDQRRTD